MMRLKERELIEARLVKRVRREGALGSVPEAFSDAGIPFRASRLGEGGAMESTQRGLKSGEKIRLLTGCGLDVRAGDGVYAGDGFYIVQSVQRWIAHQEMICEARA